MATNLYINPDNTIGGLESGKVMMAPTQEEFEDCCCVNPCADCGGTPEENLQPNLEATVVVTCDNAACLDCNGAYYHSLFQYGDPGLTDCQWMWLSVADPETFYINVFYDVLSGLFTAQARNTWVWNRRFGTDDITGDVSCDPVTHKLVGTFSLDGQGDCSGCILEVTLGG